MYCGAYAACVRDFAPRPSREVLPLRQQLVLCVPIQLRSRCRDLTVDMAEKSLIGAEMVSARHAVSLAQRRAGCTLAFRLRTGLQAPARVCEAGRKP